MKRRMAFIIVSVMMLLCLTVNAMAITVGTTEWEKGIGAQTTRKVVVTAAGKMTQKIKDVTKRAYFDGTHPLHVSYSYSGSGTSQINGGVAVDIKKVLKLSGSYTHSWTAGEVAGYVWDITKGDKVGYYNIRYNKKFDKYNYSSYMRISTIFETGPWNPAGSGTCVEADSTDPFFALGYSKN